MKSRGIFAILFLIVTLYAFRLWQTTGCKQYLPHKFEPISITIGVESDTNLDKGTNKLLTRFFHNKLTVGGYEISKSYASTFNSVYLFQVLGPLGIILISAGLYYVVTKRIKAGLIHVLIVLASSLYTILTLNSKNAFYLQAISLMTFSLWGSMVFLKSKLYTIIFITLLIATLVFFLWTWQMNAICNNMTFK